MIDLHSHILAGLDDGAGDLQESLGMLRIAAETGTTDIVASPHASPEFPFRADIVEEKIAELIRDCAEGPRIHAGCDLHLTYDNIQDVLANPHRYTIGHKNYLLVEFSDVIIAKSIDEVFSRMRGAGIVPVITHPERNNLLLRRIDQLAAWVEAGCALQLTAQSFLGRFGGNARRFCGELMRRSLVHFVASDAHDCQDRPPRLDLAYEQVARMYGGARADRLFRANPGAALRGEPLEEEPEPEPEPRKWYRVW